MKSTIFRYIFKKLSELSACLLLSLVTLPGFSYFFFVDQILPFTNSHACIRFALGTSQSVSTLFFLQKLYTMHLLSTHLPISGRMLFSREYFHKKRSYISTFSFQKSIKQHFGEVCEGKIICRAIKFIIISVIIQWIL